MIRGHKWHPFYSSNGAGSTRTQSSSSLMRTLPSLRWSASLSKLLTTTGSSLPNGARRRAPSSHLVQTPPSDRASVRSATWSSREVHGGYATAMIAPAAEVSAAPKQWIPQHAADLLRHDCGGECWRGWAGPGDTVLPHGALGAVGVALRSWSVDRRSGWSRRPATRAPGPWLRFCGVPVRCGTGLLNRVLTEGPVDAVGDNEAVEVSVALVADRRASSRIVTIAAPARDAAEGFAAWPGPSPTATSTGTATVPSPSTLRRRASSWRRASTFPPSRRSRCSSWWRSHRRQGGPVDPGGADSCFTHIYTGRTEWKRITDEAKHATRPPWQSAHTR
ncbi:hypothetical protein LX13_001809 [Williamsia maris]|uniref:Uncharacterized protein n=1 Tax=Williamsia maris TaxID=72806 RepID=A0ABT1HCK5_9NOCA|nr:hypothetical protein [Williamsia maris]